MDSKKWLGACRKAVMLAVLWVCVYPIFFVWIGSFAGDSEIAGYLRILERDVGDRWALFPNYMTLKGYVQILLDTPEFFVAFWNSAKITCAAVTGQLAVNLPISWWFAQSRCKGKELIYKIYIVLMILPFVVLMLPEYLALKRFGLLDSLWSVILPGIFSPFPVFVMVPYMKAVPKTLLEAAELDGAGGMALFLRIGIPYALPGIIVSVILNFIEYWGSMEQILAFVENKALWPLPLYSLSITLDKGNVSFVAAVMAMVIPAYVILLGYHYLEKGWK